MLVPCNANGGWVVRDSLPVTNHIHPSLETRAAETFTKSCLILRRLSTLVMDNLRPGEGGGFFAVDVVMPILINDRRNRSVENSHIGHLTQLHDRFADRCDGWVVYCSADTSAQNLESMTMPLRDGDII